MAFLDVADPWRQSRLLPRTFRCAASTYPSDAPPQHAVDVVVVVVGCVRLGGSRMPRLRSRRAAAVAGVHVQHVRVRGACGVRHRTVRDVSSMTATNFLLMCASS